MRDIVFGQFYPAESVVHRLDPRTKLLLTIVYIVMIFLGGSFYCLALCTAFLIFTVAISGVPAKMILRSIKPVIFVSTLTAVLNLFYVSGGTLIWHWWIFSIYDKGIYTAAFMALRILLAVMGSSLLTYTTSPTDLTDGIERLLSPLKKIRVPVHEFALMMTIALRFIPTLIEETDKIMSAQKARGADLESGGLFSRVRALIPILIPLFVSSFRRAFELATAMECRCYHGGEGRTRMTRLQLHFRDAAAFMFVACVLAGVILLMIFTPSVL